MWYIVNSSVHGDVGDRLKKEISKTAAISLFAHFGSFFCCSHLPGRLEFVVVWRRIAVVCLRGILCRQRYRSPSSPGPLWPAAAGCLASVPTPSPPCRTRSLCACTSASRRKWQRRSRRSSCAHRRDCTATHCDRDSRDTATLALQSAQCRRCTRPSAPPLPPRPTRRCNSSAAPLAQPSPLRPRPHPRPCPSLPCRIRPAPRCSRPWRSCRGEACQSPAREQWE